MPTTIPSAQLQAITRLEFAADALDKALRAVQDPELEFAGGAIVAPPGLKHLGHIRSTLGAIERTIRPADSTAHETPSMRTVTSASAPETNEPALSDVGSLLLGGVTVGLAADLRAALARARAQLRLLPELQRDPERLDDALQSALHSGSRLGRRVYDALDSGDKRVG